MSKYAKYMRTLRENRLYRRQCTRCGKDKLADGYTQCSEYRDYIANYKLRCAAMMNDVNRIAIKPGKSGQPTELSKDIIEQVVDSEMRKLWDMAIKSSDATTFNLDKDNDFFKEIIKERRKYDAMTPKERTLYHTSDRFDTVICPDSHIKQLLIEEFGELNYVISNLTKDVVLFDSRFMWHEIEDE